MNDLKKKKKKSVTLIDIKNLMQKVVQSDLCHRHEKKKSIPGGIQLKLQPRIWCIN